MKTLTTETRTKIYQYVYENVHSLDWGTYEDNEVFELIVSMDKNEVPDEYYLRVLEHTPYEEIINYLND